MLAASAVINGNMTLGSMLAVQYIIGQLNSPVDQLMTFIYSLQDVRLSLERINEIHQGKNEETDGSSIKTLEGSMDIEFENVTFKYNIHALENTINGV